MSKKKSRMATRGGGECNWDAIWLLGRERKRTRNWRQRRSERDDASIRDMERQERDALSGLSNAMTLVHVVLTNNKGMTLAQARETVSTLQQ